MHYPQGRGPVGLDEDFLLFDLDSPDVLLGGGNFPSHAGSTLRGPAGTANLHVNPDQSRGLSPGRSITSTPSASQLSPVQYADLFHNLRVSYFDPDNGMASSVTVDVHVYNNNHSAGTRANMNEKGALVSAVKRELRRAGGLGLISVEANHKYQIAHCFFGKANPDEFRITLMHALRYNRATPTSLQRYCDRVAKLGVDCSGFVNTYFERIGKISRHKNISEYERGTLRMAGNEIQDLDVLIWQGTAAHIAVIDHVITGSNPLKMIVVESGKSKGGLTTSEYTMLGVRGGIFRFNRGGTSTKAATVKIAQV